MQVASHGARAATRNGSNFIHHSAPSTGATSRGHVRSYVRPHPHIPHYAKTQRLFTQSRNLLAQFFSHLTAPGLRAPVAPSFAPSFHRATRVSATIQRGFSLPARIALSRPLQPYYIPRAPAAIPRAMSQVGLGTARNFTSGRPVFQNLVDNIPVAGRAFYEADWELKMRQERVGIRKVSKSKLVKKPSSGKEMLKPKVEGTTLRENRPTSAKSAIEDDLEHYFAAPTTTNVTTYLLIPLAPTPTARAPLPPSTSANSSLLPLPALAYMHASHEMHSLRVSSLFARLDASKVWEHGVKCSAYSQAGSTEGVCTVLKVEFVGWSKAKVRSVIGESGTGWCVLEEVEISATTELESFADGDELSDTSSIFSGVLDDSSCSSRMDMGVDADIDPSQSFVLPTLDFSSSFLVSSSSPPQPSFDIELFSTSNSDFDPWLESNSTPDSDLSATSSWVDTPAVNEWSGFSSQFIGRAEG